MSRIFHKSFGAAAVGAVLTAVLGVAAAGTAAASTSQCPAGKYCQWVDQDYTGTFGDTAGDVPNFGAMNDRVTSFWNNTDHYVTLYVNADYQGECVWVAPNGWSYHLPLRYNDQFSSVRQWKRGDGCGYVVTQAGAWEPTGPIPGAGGTTTPTPGGASDPLNQMMNQTGTIQHP
ncbi:peptidase inhibitor family I36 protein [Streptomyces sp. TLI_171]|uniref:peptidase inhibitor family I36 protein n=1 Tax=Streptomyces sp. TLI_171 TaxID=1938859 RepID=UPI000C19B9A6|nr:peptidase inhibitor family I36 protein [Streptomyces sp. TLI_171]RKE23669.1 peptidase inhibitor family I36 [Streptomyces sp. TLI_171]